MLQMVIDEYGLNTIRVVERFMEEPCDDMLSRTDVQRSSTSIVHHDCSVQLRQPRLARIARSAIWRQLKFE